MILISIDTLRADRLGCYGHSQPTSPNVDRFAGEAVLFENAFSQAPSTEPSHASMFTSLIPVHHGALRARHQPITPDVVTMPEILKEAGYKTISFNGGGQVAGANGFARGFDVYESSKRDDRFSDKVDSTIAWLEANPSGKFFLFLHTYEIHHPYMPKRHFLARLDQGYAGSLPGHTSTQLLREINEGKRKIDDADLRHIENTYHGEILSMDEAFGRLIAFLKERKLYDKTIVVFTSDHGEEFGEHGKVGAHSHTVYDELLRVPLIVKLPRSRLGASRVAPDVRCLDILPTVLDVLGLPLRDQFQGVSLVPLAMGRKGPDLEAVGQQDTDDASPPTSIRLSGRKLIVGPRDLASGADARWVRQQIDFEMEGKHLSIPVASATGTTNLQVLVDGRLARLVGLAPKRQVVSLDFADAKKRKVTLSSSTPCTSAADLGITASEDCVSFRIFSPDEYYVVSDDPREQQNLLADPAQRDAVLGLRKRLAEALHSRPLAGQAPDVEMDPETLERLRALGYVQ